MTTKKPVAKAPKAGKTNQTKKSLVKVVVLDDKGEWISPEKASIHYIDEDAKFPDLTFEIKTDQPPPYKWSWEIKWVAKACPQAEGKKRFKTVKEKTFSKKGNFSSDEKKWKTVLGAVIGGELSVKVEAGEEKFLRRITIKAKNPSKEKIDEHIDTYGDKKDGALLKKIFKQESNYRQHYSDEMPLTSFDNGFGLGQLTNPEPTYEQVWNWKAHVKEIMEKRLPNCRKIARSYLDGHSGYTDDMLDLETLVPYNGIAKGQRYHVWNAGSKKWVVNDNVTCDRQQSNKGWLMTEDENKGKTLDELRSDKDAKPFYTGKCYAEHIKNNQ